jgi:two-component system LytT family sensor kinase
MIFRRKARQQTAEVEPDYQELVELTREQLVEAQLRSLRAQISPHFIYNSLNAIAGLIPVDPTRARELLVDFADFIRYSLGTEGDFTTLEDELTAVERYVILEKARFGERLQVSLDIAPEVLGLQIPFLSVQPLVENAVRHGIYDSQHEGQVFVRAKDSDTYAEISVEDGGAGADPEFMAKLMRGEAEGSHVGLRNVDLRLRQAYGPGHGLHIETAIDAGMSVSMRIPKFVTPARIVTPATGGFQ